MVEARTPRIAGFCASDDEQLEHRGWVAVEDVVARDLEVVVADLEARIHRHRRDVRPGEDRLAKQLQQHFVQQAHVHRRAVVALHELLDRERVSRILVAEHLREPDLVIEQQPVLATVGQHVQREADLPQERLRGLQLAQLALRQEAVLDQLIERVAAEVTLRDPADRLDVAQPARARLHVRLEVVRGVVIAVMARGLLGDLRFEEIAGRPDALGCECAPHRFEQGLGSEQQPRFDHRRRDTDVRSALALAIVDRAHAVADFQADVPHEREEALEIRLPRRGLALRQQHHDVDVGAQVQLAAAVAADGDQRELAHVLAEMLRPGGLEQRVDQARAIAHQPFDRLVVVEALLEAVVAFGERGAKRGDVLLGVAQRSAGRPAR